MQEESLVDVWLTIAWACAFIPWVWRVAGWVIVLATGVASFVKESLFDTLDKYTKNYKDFIYSAPLLIKQHVLTTILGWAKEDRGFNDRFMWINPMMEPIMKELAAKTWSEGVKALLYAEERKKNELVWMNVDDTELMDALAKEIPPITRAQIGEAKDLAEKNVQIKYEYLQKKCWTYTLWWNTLIDIKKIVSVDKIQNGEWMKLLDQLVLESEYALTDPERFGDPEKIAKQQKELKTMLDQDAKKFGLLELFYAQDKPTILYMYRYMDQCRQHLDQYWFDSAGKCIEPAYDLIIKNMEYFDTYMKYKTIDQWIDIALVSAGFTDPNFFTVRNFFAWTIDKPLSSKELYASSSRLQTILYRIATEVIWVSINNTGADIANVFNENNEKTYWIYFENGLLNINGNFFGDAQYFTDDIPTLKKMRDEVQKQVNGNDLIDVWTGDTYLNKEIGNKYILIMNQEIQRP